MLFNLGETPGNEVISWKLDNTADALTDVIRRVREGHATVKSIESLINKEFNYNVSIKVGVGSIAMMRVPTIAPNHPMLFNHGEFRRSVNNEGTTYEAKKIIKKYGFFKGSLDKKTGKAHGSFSEVPLRMAIGEDLLNKASVYTPEETAATILHECGHFYYTLELIARATNTNYQIDYITRGLLGIESETVRAEYLQEVKDRGYDNIKVDELKHAKNKEEVALLVLGEEFEQTKSDMDGNNLYEKTMFERLADNFVTRLGYGSHLSSALRKRNRSTALTRMLFSGSQKGYATAFIFIIGELQFMASYGAFIIGVAAITGAFSFDTYDDPLERIESVKLDLRAGLNDPNLDKDEKLKLSESLQAIQNLDKTANDGMISGDFTSFYTLFTRYLPWHYVRVWRPKTLQKELERLGANRMGEAKSILGI